MSRRYQEGCLYREKRKAGSDVWVFRYRDGQHNRKELIGTVEEFTNKSDALRACEHLRRDINRDVSSVRTFAELADHYILHELPRKTPYTGEVYRGYLNTWILPKWEQYPLFKVKAVAVESWLGGTRPGTGKQGKGAKSNARDFQSCDALGIRQRQPDHSCAAVSKADEGPRGLDCG